MNPGRPERRLFRPRLSTPAVVWSFVVFPVADLGESFAFSNGDSMAQAASMADLWFRQSAEALRVCAEVASGIVRQLLLLAESADASLSRSQESSTLDWTDIRASLAGDGEAYGRLVARHQQAIAHYLWRFSRDPQVHEELVQTVFVEAYYQLKSFAGRSPWSHWLQVIATRVGYRHWRLQTRQRQRNGAPLEESIVPATSAPVGHELAAAEAATRVHAALAKLPPRDRLVLTLMYLEEKSVAEIAALTGWSQSMVKVQAYRGRHKLARHLKELPQ